MTVVFEQLQLPAGGAPNPVSVLVRLAGAQGRPVRGETVSTNTAIVGSKFLTIGNGIDSSGYWELDLQPSSDILPPGTTWYCRRQVGCDLYESYLSVPITGGPYEAFTLEDDPLGTITPSALSAHASDLALHGGGVELDFKFVNTAIVVTGSSGGLIMAPVTGTRVTVPDLARPVYLHGHIQAEQQSGGPTEQSWAVMKDDGIYGVFASLDSINPAGLNTTVPRPGNLWARLPAHSQGNYLICGTGSGGNLTAKLFGSAINLVFLRAFTA